MPASCAKHLPPWPSPRHARHSPPCPRRPEDSIEPITSRTAIAAFVEGVISGPDAVAPLLAPEYQIMRSNGVGYDRAGYIGRGAGSVNARPKYALADIVATEDGGVLVTRYTLEIEETSDGKPVTRRAPRLTVFRKIGGEWRVSAHANFAQVD
jgi:hypothetical protein